MELSVNGRQRRAAQVSRIAAPQVEKTRPGGMVGTTDRTSWSREALAFLQEVNRQDMENRRRLLEAKQQKGGELEALEKSLKVMDKCQKIASRIMRGDKVPPQDEQFLMEADPDGYKLAIACRTPKEKPKEWESVLEDEEENSAETEAADPGEADSGGEAAEC